MKGKSAHKGRIFFLACWLAFRREHGGITTAYRKCGTINLERIGLIEKRLARASACLFVGMSDIVGHGRLNGPWNVAPTPPVYSLYTQTRTPGRSPTPPMGPPSTMDTKRILFPYFLKIKLLYFSYRCYNLSQSTFRRLYDCSRE